MITTVCNFIEECGEQFWPEDQTVLDSEFEALANKQDWNHISKIGDLLDTEEIDLEISKHRGIWFKRNPEIKGI